MKNFWQEIPKPILALAPMAGLTDAAFRQLCKRYGADLIYTEFASSNALVYDNEATKKMLAFEEYERPVVCQLFGQDPAVMGQAAKKIEDMGFDGVDINFGCPAYKLVKHGGGVCLMRNLPLVKQIVEAVCQSVAIPISIKIRASIRSEDRKTEYTADQLVETIKHLPVAALMIHGRSYEQPFDGKPDIEAISGIVKQFPGIVLANGGVYTPEDARELLATTGAAGVGIARGAWGKPWIFSQTKKYLSTGKYEQFRHDAIKQVILDHARLALSSKGEWGIIELRKHLVKYVSGWTNAKTARSQLVQAKSVQDIETILKAA